ncbi:dihydroorotate dehydrogenase electron transfer subunit [Picrophilus oshimae]|uniref:Dihydroorotate oxidase B, electron transfer subunit n=1 Tax=Picrophilus torridus (strain ATCC 700027 / DSM 9790 / JCM 10055 / NBRC 100828 / KAW 2/3) TaxID=1122961 RepID=A0A8G2FY36_PICTO|nr:dihydroorotate dehydrogenase electron transfer subunit [Picrophilus oshimae]SMD31548.1 dihydroorotate oxidase B, electron transfer subunit [Picrophilus oshimae DSM 9789]
MKYSYIINNVRENEKTHTIFFDADFNAMPGQFIMVWVPGYGEIPLSLSYTGKPKAITIKAYNELGMRLINYKKGERLFYRGPYGNHFTLVDGKKLIIAAGSGIASMHPLIDDNSIVIESLKNGSDIIFEDELRDRAIFTTDDGSRGIKGHVIDALKDIKLDDFDIIYVCGPELMMKSVFDFLKDKNVRAEFSLEREMKCAVGICDSCSISGIQLCTEGPVFSIEKLKEMPEFGVSRLSYSGKRIFIKV